MPERGLEPLSPCGHKNLNLACLPISPPGRTVAIIAVSLYKIKYHLDKTICIGIKFVL